MLIYSLRLRERPFGPACAKTSEDETILGEDSSETGSSAPHAAPAGDGGGSGWILRTPRTDDGPKVTALIAACPPLDVNSAYCNLLQCSDFAETCIVAERDGEILGWISGYRPPAAPERYFVWQVAVSAAARGEGLALKMLQALMERPALAGATTLTTTITADNAASWGLFNGFARRIGATLEKAPRFEREAHFAGAHDTEWEARIAPLPTAES